MSVHPRSVLFAGVFTCLVPHIGDAQSPAETLLTPSVVTALDEELSGTAARDHVSRLTAFHRVPASPGFHDAIEYVRGRLEAYGLSDIRVEQFPADGRTFFGTLLGNRGWRVESGELTEISPRPRRITSVTDVGLAVADNSESADVTAELVDVGNGASPADYRSRDVKGRLVLADGPPATVHRLAVEERGAAGLVSYTSNQQTAWWRDDTDLVRWGHLDPQGRRNTFAIMISVGEARRFQQRLAAGDRITLHATVSARNDDGFPYETLMATIPGRDPSAGEVVFSCHLDHQKPGANDNASGCSAILEIARTLETLIDEQRLATPRRTIRFVWPSEMTGTIAYLIRFPDIAARIKAAVHLDMVGGDPFVTRSVLHVTESPWSAASVTDEVAEIVARHVIDGAYQGAATGDLTRAIRAPGGSKDAFWADITPYESGSDHWIYQEGSFAIPTIYLRDWPDVYIHTNKDRVDSIEPTKIKRSMFLAAASGYYLATIDREHEPLLSYLLAGAHRRLADDARRAGAMVAKGDDGEEAANLLARSIEREQRRVRSLARFLDPGEAGAVGSRLDAAASQLADTWRTLGQTTETLASVIERRRAKAGDRRVPIRSMDVKGPLAPSADWVAAQAGDSVSRLAVAKLSNAGEVCYEIVNFIDGTRTVAEIRDAVSAEFGPVPLSAVTEYLDLLAKIGAVGFK